MVNHYTLIRLYGSENILTYTFYLGVFLSSLLIYSGSFLDGVGTDQQTYGTFTLSSFSNTHYEKSLFIALRENT